MRRNKFGFIIILISIILMTGFIFYQIESQIDIYAVDLSEFPQISFLMNPWDAGGNFILNLESSDVTIVENEQELEVEELTEINLGAQIIIVHNDGAAFTVAGDDEIPRSEILSQELIKFFNLLSSDSNDYVTLITPEGTLFSNEQNEETILSDWENFEHDFTETVPDLNVISQAMRYTRDSFPAANAGKTILFLTPKIDMEERESLDNLIFSAIQDGVRVHVGFVGRVADFESEEAEMLRDLASQTNGQFFAFSIEESIPDFNSMFESSRKAYQVVYHSQLNNSGINQLGVKIESGAGNYQSENFSFEIDLQAPNPIFLSLPASIDRYFPEDLEIQLYNLEPKQFVINILINFEDGIEREIVRTELFINGESVRLNFNSELNSFNVNIDDFQQDAKLLLKVIAEDELGMVGESMEIPIELNILDPSQDFGEVLNTNYVDLIVVALLSALGIGVLFTILSGKFRPQMKTERAYKKAKDINISDEDLIIKNVPDKEKTGPLRRIISNSADEYEVFAELHEINVETNRNKGNKFDIVQENVYLGSDKDISQILLNDPAIQGQHALIQKTENGMFVITDLNTIAGTWLNYEQVTVPQTEIKHGDNIHIGDVVLVFKLPEKGDSSEINIRFLDGEDS